VSTEAPLNKTLELYQLRTLIAVAEDGHLTHAAERLHISQPAVSAHIKALEQILDVKLFERTATGMVLTAAGSVMLERARAVLAAVDELRRGAAELKGELIGVLRVGSVSDPQSNRVGDLLACAVARYPKLQIELHHEVSGAALQAVRERELDATFYFGDAPGTEFVALPLKQIVYRVTGPAAWADRIRNADWAAISELPWVRTPAISTHSQLVQQLFASHDIKLPEHRIEADSESLIIDLVVSGVGVSLVREDAARPRVRAGEICLWPRAKLRTTLWFVCAASRVEEPLLRALLGCVRETWGRG
jgi:DNA-binding transcriptional LysR family regulator